ncbi:peptidase C14 [Microsporum canis CBS 113480]|uniref:Peptidase C14 n=1 Tax=Arthroderma otae (strain ATCC MYA-4605 / CBS 113480) TaxID=554155 RepID=C5FNC0_ARTOC|nr:peptidase C14 [Microsporum canis CBS 113480]EEQ31356.1 peptidase C14 [Microsporum canis CBS 113480]
MVFWRQQKEVKTSNGPYHGLKVLVPRPGSSGPEPVVDIIFVHGLSGDCIETWKHADAEVPWIMDKSFLGDDLYERARIMTFGYNANVFQNVTTSRVIDHANIQSTTGGLIFMGTPHEGSCQASLVQMFQNIASCFTMGQNKTSLTQELETYSASTMDINQSFMQNASRSLEIVCFYETLPTRLPQGEQMIVKKASAVINGNGARNIGMECNHLELCKFGNPEEGRFESTFRPQLEMVVDNAIRNKAAPSVSEAASALKAYYTKGNALKIQRLSGKQLPMENCYINLAIIRLDPTEVPHISESSSFLLTERLQLGLNGENVQLYNLFNPIKLSNDEEKRPKRILIRGRAGVGKSTLCKKIVYEYIHNGMWKEHFDWLIWIPLRILNGIKANGPYTLRDLFVQYFCNSKELPDLAWDAVTGSAKDKTLFVLDGLDEVYGKWKPGEPMKRFLEYLLAQDQVIITTRPYTLDRGNLEPIDLELETIGFYPEQVVSYLKNEDIVLRNVAEEIQLFLNKRPIVQELVRIPIQLDALCHSWSKTFKNEALETMTDIYQNIIKELWRKDLLQLQTRNTETEEVLREIAEPEDEEEVKDAENLVEGFAFYGMYNGIVEFGADEQGLIYKNLANQSIKSRRTPGLVLGKVSFLRTSDNTLGGDLRSYHFLHLTFQELFAARYFVRQWLDDKPLYLVESNSTTMPKIFLQDKKYHSREVAGSKPGGALEGRKKLETRLLQWVDFEWEFRKTTELLSEAEFLEVGINTFLRESFRIRKSHILRTLSRRPRLSEDTIGIITSLLKDKDTDIRKAAAEALGGQLTLPEATLDRLVLLLEDKDVGVREATVRALGVQSTLPQATIDRLVLLLKDKDTNIRVATAAALGGQSGLSQATLDKLVLLLKDKSAGIREATARALGGQSTLSQATLDGLVLLLKDKYTTIRGAAAEALGGQSTLPQATLDGLVLLLKDKNADIRGAAARALGGQSTLPQATLDKLILLLHDTNFWGTRQAAAKALGSQLNLCQAALDRLILLLKDEDWRVRSTAADTLGRGFNLSQAALNGLILLLKDEYWESRVSAASALKEQSNLPQAALDALILLLKDKDQSVRKAVANAIGGQSNLPQVAFDGLILLLKDNDWGPRNAATNALKGRPNLPQAILDSLILLLKDEDWRRSYAAANVLEGQLNLPQAVLDQLILLFKGNDWQKRISAVNVLKRQSNLPQAMLDELILLLKDKSHEVWKLAFGILSKYEGLTIPPAYIAEPQLFMWWLEKSFAQQVSVYQQENTLFFNMLGKLNHAPLGWTFRLKFQWTRRGLGMP